MRYSLAVIWALSLTAGVAANAGAVTFTATDGTASATITAVPSGPNEILTIVLDNLTTANSTDSAGNLLTGLQLVPTNIDGSGFSLTGETGTQEFTFSSQKVGAIANGTFNPTWALVSSPANALYFNGFGTGGMPIIGGPATGGTNYNNANSSLTSGPHGSYMYETATFTVQAPGSFNLSNVSSVNFLFNTDGSIVVPSTPGVGTGAPEPASLGLMGLGVLGMLVRRRRA